MPALPDKPEEEAEDNAEDDEFDYKETLRQRLQALFVFILPFLAGVLLIFFRSLVLR